MQTCIIHHVYIEIFCVFVSWLNICKVHACFKLSQRIPAALQSSGEKMAQAILTLEDIELMAQTSSKPKHVTIDEAISNLKSKVYTTAIRKEKDRVFARRFMKMSINWFNATC